MPDLEAAFLRQPRVGDLDLHWLILVGLILVSAVGYGDIVSGEKERVRVILRDIRSAVFAGEVFGNINGFGGSVLWHHAVEGHGFFRILALGIKLKAQIAVIRGFFGSIDKRCEVTAYASHDQKYRKSKRDRLNAILLMFFNGG